MELAPKYEEAAESLKDVQNLIFARYNAI